MTLSDQEILREAASGDGEAFHAVVVRYGARIVRFLDGFLDDRARAQDLAQETFVRLHQRLTAIDLPQPGNPASLLFTIAANLGRDELRRRKVRRESVLGGSGDEPAAADQQPGARLERDEDCSLVREALARLDPDVRLILMLRDVQGLSYEEIAGMIGAPLGTVKSRISRARLAFRDAWTSAGGRVEA